MVEGYLIKGGMIGSTDKAFRNTAPMRISRFHRVSGFNSDCARNWISVPG